MQKKQKYILPIAIVFLMALAVTMVSGATLSNISGIIDHNNYTSAVIICATLNDSDDCYNCRNATIWYNQTGGDVEDTATAVALCTIQSAGAIVTTNTIDFTSTDESSCATAFEALDDALTYNFTCSFGNATEHGTANATDNAGASLGARSNIGVDNTNPVVTATADFSSINLGRYFKYTTVVTDATSGLTTSYCNITDAEGDVDKDGSISTSASAVDFTYTDVAGDYVISCTGTDSAGNTDTDTVTVTAKTSGAPILFEEEGKGLSFLKDLDNKTIIIAIVVIVLLAMAVGKKK